MSKFHMNAQDANMVNSIVYLMSAFGSPLLGLIVDKTGKNLMWVSLSVACTIASHCILNFTTYNPYIGMVKLELVVLSVKLMVLISGIHGCRVLPAGKWVMASSRSYNPGESTRYSLRHVSTPIISHITVLF